MGGIGRETAWGWTTATMRQRLQLSFRLKKESWAFGRKGRTCRCKRARGSAILHRAGWFRSPASCQGWCIRWSSLRRHRHFLCSSCVLSLRPLVSSPSWRHRGPICSERLRWEGWIPRRLLGLLGHMLRRMLLVSFRLSWLLLLLPWHWFCCFYDQLCFDRDLLPPNRVEELKLQKELEFRCNVLVFLWRTYVSVELGVPWLSGSFGCCSSVCRFFLAGLKVCP